MDIREFAQEFQENIKMAIEMGKTDPDLELASAILEYIEDNGYGKSLKYILIDIIVINILVLINKKRKNVRAKIDYIDDGEL